MGYAPHTAAEGIMKTIVHPFGLAWGLATEARENTIHDQRSGLREEHSVRHSGCTAPKWPMRAPLPPALRVLRVLSARAAAALPTPPRAAALEAEAAHTLAAQPPNHSLPLRGGCCQGLVRVRARLRVGVRRVGVRVKD